GRYRLFMADMVFFVVAALGCAVAPNEWVLIVFRFVMGIGVGLDLPVAMAFLAEFSKLKGRGNRSQRVNAWSPAWYFATGVGYLVVLIIFVTLPYELHAIPWRIVVGFRAVPAPIVLPCRRRSQPDNASSPAWYFATGVGYLVVLIIFVALPYEQHAILWRIVVGFGAVPALIALLVRRRYLAESPEWLANQGDLRAAVDVMRSHHNLDVELAPVEDRD